MSCSVQSTAQRHSVQNEQKYVPNPHTGETVGFFVCFGLKKINEKF